MAQHGTQIGPHAFMVDKLYTWFGRGQPHFQDIPPKQIMKPEEFDSPLGPLHKFQWVAEEIYHTVFIPKGWAFRGPLFERLAYHTADLPIVSAPGGYALSKELKNDWHLLEINLCAVISCMLRMGKCPRPPGYRWWCLPIHYKYDKVFGTRGEVEAAAIRARDSFRALIGVGTYAFLLLEDGPSDWRDQVVHRTGIHLEWLNQLERSICTDFDVPRIGGIIELHAGSAVFGIVKQLARVDAAVYMTWLNTDLLPSPYLTHPILRECAPSIQDFLSLHRNEPPAETISLPPHLVGTSPAKVDYKPYIPSHRSIAPAPPGPSRRAVWPPRQAPQLSPQTQKPSLPEVESGSHQRPGESWQDFFQRRHSNNLERMLHESEGERHSRLQKLQHAQKYPEIGRQGPVLFVWIEDIATGFRVRKWGGRQNYNHILGKRRKSHKVYDPFRNQWDVCTEFGDATLPSSFMHTPNTGNYRDDRTETDSVSEFNYSDPGDFSEGFEFDADFDVTAPLDLPLPNLSGASIADVRRFCPATEYLSDEMERVNQESLEEILYLRWGIKVSASVHSSGNPLDWNRCLTVLGRAKARNSIDPSDSFRKAIGCIFQQLSVEKSPSPSPSIDIHTPHPFNNLNYIQLREIIEFQNRKFYILDSSLSPPSSEPHLVLAVTNPVDILEIFRRNLGPDLLNVATALAEKGIEFHFCHLISNAATTPTPRDKTPRWPGLGYRPLDYNPTSIDYVAYTSERDTFLTGPRGHLALCRGGLFARFAREVISISASVLKASEGILPSSLRAPSRTPGAAYFFEMLTDNEQQIISGVYHVSTELTSQLSAKSWWPRANIWEKSGLNQGYWTADCEYFLQRRLDEINSNVAQLRAPAQWRASLKFSKVALPIHIQNATNAHKFLLQRK